MHRSAPRSGAAHLVADAMDLGPGRRESFRRRPVFRRHPWRPTAGSHAGGAVREVVERQGDEPVGRERRLAVMVERRRERCRRRPCAHPRTVSTSVSAVGEGEERHPLGPGTGSGTGPTSRSDA